MRKTILAFNQDPNRCIFYLPSPESVVQGFPLGDIVVDMLSLTPGGLEPTVTPWHWATCLHRGTSSTEISNILGSKVDNVPPGVSVTQHLFTLQSEAIVWSNATKLRYWESITDTGRKQWPRCHHSLSMCTQLALQQMPVKDCWFVLSLCFTLLAHLKYKIYPPFKCLRPYLRESTSYRLITEVKPWWAGIVLGWVTA